MAYINAQETAQIRNALKVAFPTMKFSVRKQHSMSLHVAVLKGNIDLQDGQINEYYLDKTSHPDFWNQVLDIIKNGSDRKWFNESDSQSDYFHIAFYIHMRVGEWNKPYINTELQLAA
jgi:hypothetical protein